MAADGFENSQSACQHVKKTVSQGSEYSQNFLEIYMLVKLRSLFGCCCKNKDWYNEKIRKLERHEKAVDVLTKELDIVKQIKGDRVTDFLAKVSLKRYQRALVSSFA